MSRMSQYPAVGSNTTDESEQVLVLRNGSTKRMTLAEMNALRQAASTVLTAFAALGPDGFVKMVAGAPSLVADPGAGLYDPLGTAVATLAAHVAAADPHAQYLLESTAAILYEPIGTASTLLAAHVAAENPHNRIRARSVILDLPIGAVGEVSVPAAALGSKFKVERILHYAAPSTPVLGQVGVYSRTGGGGTTIVTANTITSMTSPTVILTRGFAGSSNMTVFSSSTDQIFARTTVLNAAPMTIKVIIDFLVLET